MLIVVVRVPFHVRVRVESNMVEVAFAGHESPGNGPILHISPRDSSACCCKILIRGGRIKDVCLLFAFFDNADLLVDRQGRVEAAPARDVVLLGRYYEHVWDIETA